MMGSGDAPERVARLHEIHSVVLIRFFLGVRNFLKARTASCFSVNNSSSLRCSIQSGRCNKKALPCTLRNMQREIRVIGRRCVFSDSRVELFHVAHGASAKLCSAFQIGCLVNGNRIVADGPLIVKISEAISSRIFGNGHYSNQLRYKVNRFALEI